MSIVNVNQPNFFGNDGLPLKSGYIWIGEPNKSPIDFPLTVTFTDSLGNSFPATQPLRTNNQGKIQWNGKAIIASVDSNYSMLIQDSTQTDINNGYIPEIDATNSGGGVDLNGYRRYGLLLSEIQQFDVVPGQTVGNIGKLTVSDNLGAEWLVVSPTGSPADDIDIIDFENGLQGVRKRNFLQPQDNLDTITDPAAARGAIDVYSTSETYSTSQADSAIAAGVEPRLATRTNYFTGSSTSIDFDSFVGGHPGDGFYIIRYNASQYNALVYVIEGQAMKAAVQATATTAPRTDVVEINYTGLNVMTVSLYSTVTGTTALNINTIDKVG